MSEIGRDCFVDQARESDSTFHRFIMHEVKFRNGAHFEEMRQFAAQKARRARQRLEADPHNLVALERGNVHLCVREIPTHVNGSDSHQPESGVPHLVADQISKFTLNLIPKAGGT